MRKLLLIILLLSVSACLAGSKTIKETWHADDLKKTIEPCTTWHVKMHGKDFDYKRSFCYQWKTIKKGKAIWHVRYWDFIEDHDYFVSRGIWKATR